MKNFAVIQFSKGSAVDYVPSSWINDQLKCRYPKSTHPDFEKLRKTPGSTPPKSWPKYSVVIVKYYDDVMKAERKAINYLENSDIESSEAEGRQESTICGNQAFTRGIGEHHIEIITQPSNVVSKSSIQAPESFVGPSHVFALVDHSSTQQELNRSSQFVPPQQPLGFPLPAAAPRSPQIDNGSSDNSTVLNKILEKQIVLEEQIKDIKKLLLAAVSNPPTGSPKVPSIPYIPIASPSELDSFESWIQTQGNFNLYAVSSVKDSTVFTRVIVF